MVDEYKPAWLLRSSVPTLWLIGREDALAAQNDEGKKSKEAEVRCYGANRSFSHAPCGVSTPLSPGLFVKLSITTGCEVWLDWHVLRTIVNSN